MLQISNLTITHLKDLRTILEDFNLVLNDGDKAVIIGEEGNGKSTLLKWIYKPELIEDYCEYKGHKSHLNEKLAYLPQELPAEDSNKSVYEFFLEVQSFTDKTPNELSKLAIDFNLPIDFYYSQQLMSSLSGGEKVKVQLMRLLIDNPTILLLDEPSNDINLDTLNVLEKLINDFKHIIIFVSHDEVLIERTANVIIHLEQIDRKTISRYTIAKKDYRSYILERENAFDKQRQQAIFDKREKKLRDERYQRVMQSVEHALKTTSRQNPAEAKNLKDKMHTVKAMGKRFEKEDEKMMQMPMQEEVIYLKLGGQESVIPAGKMVLDYQLDALYSRDNETILAKDIRLCVKGPTKVCIIGANGIGKTTFIKMLVDNLATRSDIKVAYMPQNYEDLLDMNLTPVQYLAPNKDKESTTWVRTCLGSMKYTSDEMEHAISELSGGQKAKLFLLKLNLSKANVLILDEPTRNFSPLSGPVIRRLIKDFPGAVISVSHDRKYIDEVADEVYRLTDTGLEKIKG